ncbi:hypothetical protein MUN74_18440 [Agromyces endophyticus]|uniref:hypothetical protein n=1 Tax=Agromyces sp. H17E-10 TaxID=2932244 RepID=UPI001FD3DC5F|nr:hypothetical protein [Agromyces sp. H17E-10]UOQ89211.1 hypothetical protein MUN74_18440 [Agromyces sp. H17E-10]
MVDVLKLDRDEFEKLVELLILRMYQRNHPELVATPVDGRGGDGGIDIDVRVKKTNQLVKIYQLKHFPEGFSGAWGKSRKPQIKKSFNAAMKEEPPVWALVIPRNISVSERKWVTTISNTHKVRIEYIGETALNSMLTDDPDVADRIERNAHREALKVVARDSAALADSHALMDEVRRLSEKANARSAFWGMNFSVDGGAIMETIYARRPDAPDHEPLAINFEADFTDRQELRADWQRMLAYGSFTPVVLPADVIKKFQKVGPDWFASSSDGGILEVHATRSDRSDPTRIRVRPRTPGPARSISGTTIWSTAGTDGGIVRMTLTGGLTMTWTLSFALEGDITVNIDFAPPGNGITDVRNAIAFLEAFNDAGQIAMEIGGHKIDMTISRPGGIEISQFVKELLDDLAVIERETGARFSFPSSLEDSHERIWARVLRAVLEGRCMLMPGVSGLNFTLEGTLSEGMENLLTSGGAILASQADYEHELFGETVVIGELFAYMPAAHVPDSAAHLAALKAGVGRGRRIDIEPIENAGIRVYRPRPDNPDSAIELEPWGIEGLKEHPELRDESGAESIAS